MSGGLGNERGVALLITLLVVTLLTITVLEFTYSTEIDGHITRNSLASVQARALARSGVALAEITLKVDALAKNKNPPERARVETLSDPWAQPFPPMPVGQGFGTAGFTIVDESGRWNLNAFARRGAQGGQDAQSVMRQQAFQGVLEASGLDPNLLFALIDWVDPGDDSDREEGAESPYYLGLQPPYVPRNGKLLSVEEVVFVKGFSELTWEQWTLFRSLVTVLPNENLKINVNTAPELLLKGMFARLRVPPAGEDLVAFREEKAIEQQKELSDFLNGLGVEPLVASILGTRSEFFTIYATGSAADVKRSVAVTEQMRPGIFPPRLTVLSWREDVLLPPVSLTSPEASDRMNSTSPQR